MTSNNSNKVNVDVAKVLVAEDHELNQALIKKILQKSGFVNFEIANDGLDAWNTYKEKDFDIILMDCHMPEMNGFQVTQKIRDSEKNSDQRIPIIAITADAMAGTKEKCLDAGMDDYITKPISIKLLHSAMNRWIMISENKPTPPPSNV